MGLNISSMMVWAVLIIVLSLMSRVSIGSQTDSVVVMTEAVDLAGERARTNFKITKATSGGANWTVLITNTGTTTISDFADMDFIVDYIEPAGGGTHVITRLTYTEGALGNNQWKKTSITPDDFQPGAWNSGETITLDAQLNPPQQPGTPGRVAVGTPNGVLAAGTLDIGVNFDAASSAQGSGTTMTWSHIVTGTNTFLWVGIVNNRIPVSSVTYAGQALTFLGTEKEGDARLEIWFKVAPLTGTNNIVVTLSAAGVMVAGASSWTGVDQTNPMGTPVFDKFEGGNPTVTVNSALGEEVVDAISSFDAAGLPTVGPVQAQRWNLQNTTDPMNFGAGSSEPGAASVTMSWTTDGRSAIGAVSLKAAQ